MNFVFTFEDKKEQKSAGVEVVKLEKTIVILSQK